MKTQKTIRLDDDYRLKNGAVERYVYDAETWVPSKEHVTGNPVVLGSREYVGPNNSLRGHRWFYLHFDAEGIPGNLDATVKSRNGWRGTTDDYSTHGHGLRKIIRIGETKSGQVTVTVGPDIGDKD